MSNMSRYMLRLEYDAEDVITNMDGSFTLAKDEVSARARNAKDPDTREYWEDVLRVIRKWENMT